MQFAEHKRLMEILDQEREKILVEKAKLETMERLKIPSKTSNTRQSELDAAIRIAQVMPICLVHNHNSFNLMFNNSNCSHKGCGKECRYRTRKFCRATTKT